MYYVILLLLLPDLSSSRHYDYFLNRFLLAQADSGLAPCRADEGADRLIFLHYSNFRRRQPHQPCQTSYFVF